MRKSYCNTHGREPVDTLRTFYIKPFVQLLLRDVAHNFAHIRSVARIRTLLKATEDRVRAAQNALGVSRGRVPVQIYLQSQPCAKNPALLVSCIIFLVHSTELQDRDLKKSYYYSFRRSAPLSSRRPSVERRCSRQPVVSRHGRPATSGITIVLRDPDFLEHEAGRCLARDMLSRNGG